MRYTLPILLTLAACARHDPMPPAACTILDSTLYCNDGTALPISNGKDGKDGTNGTNGTNGTSATVTAYTFPDTSTCVTVASGVTAKRFSGTELRLHMNGTCTASYEAITTSNEVKYLSSRTFLIYEIDGSIYTLRKIEL